jgi:hypothetical protein
MAKTKQTARKGSGAAWKAQQKFIQRKREEEAEEKKKQQAQYEAGCEKIKRDHEDKARKGNQAVSRTATARQVARLCVPKSVRDAQLQQLKEQRTRREIFEIVSTAEERSESYIKRLTTLVEGEVARLRSGSFAAYATFAQTPAKVDDVPPPRIPNPVGINMNRWGLPQEERKDVDEKELYVQSLARQCDGRKNRTEDVLHQVHDQFVADLRAAATRAADGLAALLNPPRYTIDWPPPPASKYLDDEDDLGQHDPAPLPGDCGCH